MKQYPYWHDSQGLDRDAVPADSPADLPARVDVAIIGGGYTGLSAARALARGGASVAVLERDRIGSGASSRNGGQVLTGMKLDAGTLVSRFGERRARELFDLSLDAIAMLEQLVADEGMLCEYERTGHLQAASKPSHFDGFRDEQALLSRVFNHRVAIVPRAEQHAELGTDAYFGLLVDERSGAVNPALFVDRLAAAARRAGAVTAEGTPVTALRRQAASWAIATGRGTLEAADLLVATNGYTDRAVPWMQRRFVPIGSYVIATAPIDEARAAALVPKRRMVFDSKHFLHYFRVTRDRRLLFGGRAEFARPDADTTRRCAAILRRDMLALFPSLADTAVDYAWSGNVAFTRDQMPHAGRLHGAYYAGGYGGHGIAMATYLGALVARRIAGERIDHPLMDDRFPAIPFYRGTPWFLPIVGAYYRMLDWLQ